MPQPALGRVVVILTVLFAPAVAWVWREEGHKVVATIAREYVAPARQEEGLQ
jgi:hypothetical protein